MPPLKREAESDDDDSLLDDEEEDEKKIRFTKNEGGRDPSSEEDEDLEKGWLNTDGIYAKPGTKTTISDEQLWKMPDELRRKALFENGQRKAYLVRVPKYLAETWTKAAHAPGEVLAELSNTSLGGPMHVQIPQNDPKYAALPSLYTMESSRLYTDMPPEMAKNFVLSTDAENNATHINCTLSGEFYLQTDVSDVDNMRKAQMAISQPIAEKNRKMPTVKPLDDLEEKSLNIYQSQSVTQSQKRKIETRKKAEVIRKERLPRPQLIDLLFNCFRDYEYWTFRALQEHTQQPQQYLREILVEVANIVRRGPYIGKYTLKPEFKDSTRVAAENANDELHS